MEQQKRFFRIEALHNSGEYKKLLEPGEKYLELYPEDKVATMYLATGLLVTGNYVAAARRLNLAEKMPLALHEKKWAQELRQNLYKAILEKRREKKSPAAHVSAKRQPASIHQ